MSNPFELIDARLTGIESLLLDIKHKSPQQTTAIDPEPYVYGINGLAKFLQVSNVTAQKLKNSGKIPFSQAERTIIFKKEEILKALSNKTKSKTEL